MHHPPAEASESSWRRFCCDGLDGGGATSLLTSLPPCPEGLVGKIRNGRGHQIKSSISKWSVRTEVFHSPQAPEVPSRGALKAFTEAGSCIPASLHGEATERTNSWGEVPGLVVSGARIQHLHSIDSLQRGEAVTGVIFQGKYESSQTHVLTKRYTW